MSEKRDDPGLLMFKRGQRVRLLWRGAYIGPARCSYYDQIGVAGRRRTFTRIFWLGRLGIAWGRYVGEPLEPLVRGYRAAARAAGRMREEDPAA